MNIPAVIASEARQSRVWILLGLVELDRHGPAGLAMTAGVVAWNKVTTLSSLWLSRLNWIASAAPRNDGGVVIARPKAVAIQFDQARQNPSKLISCNSSGWIASAAPRNDGGVVIASPKGVAIQFDQAQPNKTGLARCARNDGGGTHG